MATLQKAPQRRRWYNDLELFTFGFVRSNYVTALTEWFMGLAGKSAQLVLIFTVLYMSAELYPGVDLPAALSLFVFILQMVALDAGGIGLASMARQAHNDGNDKGAEGAELLSKWMIGVMIAGLVVVSVETAVSHLPNLQSVQGDIDAVKELVEVVLIIARAVCAVLYGRVIHDLRTEHPDTAVVPVKSAMQQMEDISAAIQRHTAETERRLQSVELKVAADLKGMLDEIRAFQVTVNESLSPIEGLSNLPDLAGFTAQIETTVTELRTEIAGAQQAMLAQLPAPSGSARQQTTTVSTRTTRTARLAAPRSPETKRDGEVFDKKAFVWGLLDAALQQHEDEPSVSFIQSAAAEAGQAISTGSVFNYRQAWRDRRAQTQVIESTASPA